MSKYSYELKKKLVTEYMNGEAGYDYLTKKYEIPSTSTARRWINATEMSYQELALSVGIKTPGIVTEWVRRYRAAGPDALRPRRKGRRPQVSKPKKEAPQTEKEKADAEYLRQLEEENLRLRIENAYLKELRRLRLEDEAKNGRHG